MHKGNLLAKLAQAVMRADNSTCRRTGGSGAMAHSEDEDSEICEAAGKMPVSLEF